MKCSSAFGQAFRPRVALVQPHDCAADGQTQSRAPVVRSAALEFGEQTIQIVHIDARAKIFHGDDDVVAGPCGVADASAGIF